MSNPLDTFSNSLNIETIRTIDQLNLPIMQKHHVRILAHCLAILKTIYRENNSSLSEEKFLREWCHNQSKQFNDQEFSDLLYNQLALTLRKLKSFSKRIEKSIEDIDVDDLVLLVTEG